MEDTVTLKCHNCGHVWNYGGNSIHYATCPTCRFKVKIRVQMVNRMKCKLEGMKIVYEDLGYMITFESEDGLVMIRDLDGEAISLRHMLKLVDLVLVTQHNESKGKRKKKEPVYDPDLFVRDPIPNLGMTAEEQNAHLVSRRPVVMSQINWLLNENKDYGKLVRELPPLKKELTEIDAVLVVAR